MRPSYLTRRTFCGLGLVAASSWALADEPPRDVTAAQDFDELWRTLGERYCYFGEKTTDWAKVRELYRPEAVSASTDEAFLDVLHRVLSELYDVHTHLSSPAQGSPRWAGHDLIAEADGNRARITAVREDSAAAIAGMEAGDLVLKVGEMPVASLAAAHLPRCLSRPDPEADRYAWNVAVAGRRGQNRTFLTQKGSAAPVRVTLDDSGTPPEVDLSWKRLDDDFGYMRIASFANRAAVPTFDAALAALEDTRGLIIDVRRNGGGDTGVARPMMGRFIRERKAYARMRRRDGAGLGGAWTEYVEPRGPSPYAGPVVVLTDHWSASMAEGFPMGMRAIVGARIVGTPMAQLGAAVFGLRLDRTGVQAQYSGEPVYDVRDIPRSAMRPDVEVAEGSDILAAGLAELKRLLNG